MIESRRLHSIIFWGPPGCGKTTLAGLIAHDTGTTMHTVSAVSSGVADVRKVIDQAQRAQASLFAERTAPILFIDEIHRFSKAQQDSLLAAVERGTVTLIGATTENPSFSVITPLLSRCQTYVLRPLEADDLRTLAQRAVDYIATHQQLTIALTETAALLRYSGGDARRLLNIISVVADNHVDAITDEVVERLLTDNPLPYDRDGEQHYDTISAFIKSIRGSDPDAAIYWLARMLAGGEDPRFIARRLVISASEDIGLANPNAMLLAEAAYTAAERLGMPEVRIPLAEATIYLATAQKSNTAYNAINAALAEVNRSGALPVPLHLRNAPTKLMKSLGYADGYKYPHDYPQHFTPQQYRPDALRDTRFYDPSPDNPTEQAINQRQQQRWQ